MKLLLLIVMFSCVVLMFSCCRQREYRVKCLAEGITSIEDLEKHYKVGDTVICRCGPMISGHETPYSKGVILEDLDKETVVSK